MKNLLILLLLFTAIKSYSQQTLYSRATANTWSLTNGGADCGCFPTAVDTVELSHNWANSSFYPLTHPANLAFGTYFPVSSVNNPFKVVIRSGGVGYQTGTIPTGMILQVDNGGMWAFNGSVTFNTTAANSIALIENNGAILVNGSFTNNLAINSPGEFCTSGTFTQNLGGTFNGIADADLAPHFTHTNYGGFANCLQMVVLPVELLSFTANRHNTNYVTYNWVTASEINNDYFRVEISIDGITWKTRTSVSGAGNTFDLTYYSEDKETGTEYKYTRLVQTDYDGTTTYSSIRSIATHFDGITIISKDHSLNITTEEIAHVYVYSYTGKMVYNSEISKGFHEINLYGTVRGVYMCRINSIAYKFFVH